MHFVGLSDLCVGVCYYFCLYFHMSAVSVWVLPVASLFALSYEFSPSLLLPRRRPLATSDLRWDGVRGGHSYTDLPGGRERQLFTAMVQHCTADPVLWREERWEGGTGAERHGEPGQEKLRKCQWRNLISYKIHSNTRCLRACDWVHLVQVSSQVIFLWQMKSSHRLC